MNVLRTTGHRRTAKCCHFFKVVIFTFIEKIDIIIL